MKKALISPNEIVLSVTGWVDHAGMLFPEESQVVNACRIAQVADSEFEVAAPLFWIDCENNVTSDTHYYDTAENAVKARPADVEKPKV